MSDQYNILLQDDEMTVVSHYTVEPIEGPYQSEKALEEAFIKQLQAQGYEYLPIKDEQALLANLRLKLEQLNGIQLSDPEWARLKGMVAKDNSTIEEKTQIIQRDHILNLTLDNGTTKNIRLLDKRNIHNNQLQVINQYVPTGGSHANRYDVTILVNGLPLVHVELKRRGVNIKEAFNQIDRYQRESFWSGCGLYDYVQIFVVSNGDQTKYYSNTTRFAHCADQQHHKLNPIKRATNSFEFTSYWSDADNQPLTDLTDFTKTFMAKHTLLNVLTKYCVFTVDKNLLVMRPYQIAATERILLRIQQALINKWQGTIRAGGYVWHTTGSGKTLTSFKAAQLASQMEGIDKVLFVVDRQDLDYQTMKEYDNFEKDCANGNSSSKILKRQLNDPDPTKKIIITTIQKLSILLNKKEDINVLDKNVVMIFDECHRSQFGDMHKIIVRRFKKYMIFGFTGTPIFARNAVKLTTTAQLFGGEPDADGKPTRPLHCYTIIDAIKDKNVLPFKVDYVNTIKVNSKMKDGEVYAINTAKAMHDPQRIANNVRYILNTYAQKTKRKEAYKMSTLQNVQDVIRKGKEATEKKQMQQVKGFNGMFAVDSVPTAIAYYNEFKKQQAALPQDQRLRIATIFTANTNALEEECGILPEENPESAATLTQSQKDALNMAIGDYNKFFTPNLTYSVDGENFLNYYKDVSLRMKNKEIDLLIVVGMFLTGFDAKTLNTLWVDKNLQLHGLIQAFSRTNRIFNSVKNCGNIVCFRNLEDNVKESLALFGDKDASGMVILRPFKDYYLGYEDHEGKYHEGYKHYVTELLEKYPTTQLALMVDMVQKKEFIKLFGTVLRFRNLLQTFVDEFTDDKKVVSDLMMQTYTTWYNNYHEEFVERVDAENINDDVVFEMELVKSVQVSITYILQLIAEYHATNCQDEEVLVRIKTAVGSSPDLRDKRELIERFIERISVEGDGDIYSHWEEYMAEEQQKELVDIINEEKLNAEKTLAYIHRAFADGYINEYGTSVTELLPPIPLFGAKANTRAEKKARVIERLKAFLARYDGDYLPQQWERTEEGCSLVVNGSVTINHAHINTYIDKN